MAAQVAKKYSLFQRSVRVTQTSIRRLNAYLMERMPGLPNPPEIAEQINKPTFKDLWEFTLTDHVHNFRDAWRDYKNSFTDPSDIDIEKSKEDVRRAALRLRGHVEENASSNAAYLEERLEGTQVLANLKEIGTTASGNVGFLKDEFAKAQAQVDPDAVVQNVRAVVDEHRSKKDVVSTLTGNVQELADLVKTGRDAALELEAKDVEALKGEAQSWLADKLMVAQSVLVAFIDGYREGKALELEREDALLLSYAKQAAQEQSAAIKQQLEQFMAEQKQKQQREKEQQSIEASRIGLAPTAAATAAEDHTQDHPSKSETAQSEASRQ
jgi:hypothetical protein